MNNILAIRDCDMYMIATQTNKERFFIYDCLGNIAGNPKGYSSHKQAQKQLNTQGSKAFNQVWNVFNKRSDELDALGAPASGRLIYEIKPLSAMLTPFHSV